jgi:hypothetical protein
MDQNLLSEEGHGIGYLHVPGACDRVSVRFVQLNAPRRKQQNVYVAQLLGGDSSDLLCGFSLSRPSVLGSHKRCEELRIERCLRTEVVMRCGWPVFTYEFLVESRCNQPVKNALLFDRDL